MKTSKKNGFSLLEFVISMLIMSIVLPGSFAMLVSAQKQLNEAKNRLQAYNQAETVLEKLRWYVSSDMAPGPAHYGPARNAGGSESDDGVFSSGTHDPSAELLLSTGPVISDSVSGTPIWSYDSLLSTFGNMRMVTVHVSWEEL